MTLPPAAEVTLSSLSKDACASAGADAMQNAAINAAIEILGMSRLSLLPQGVRLAAPDASLHDSTTENCRTRTSWTLNSAKLGR